MAKVKNLPFQTVQFQFAAKQLRDAAFPVVAETVEEKVKNIEARKKQLIEMAEKNAEFWISQIKDQNVDC